MTLFAEIKEAVKDLQDSIPFFKDLVLLRSGGSIIVPGSVNEIFNIMNIPEIAVAKACYEKGSYLDIHRHDAVEIIIVYSGELEMEIDGEIVVIGKTDVVRIDSGVPHCVLEVRKNTHCIGITMPSDPGYPE